MAPQETTSFKGVKVVVKLARYGRRYCFHIDPGDGDTLPIYIPEDKWDQLGKKVGRLENGLVDIVVFKDPPDTRRYLKRIKESKYASH